jgi:hypothetical protein
MSHHIPAWGGSQAGPYTVEDGPVSTPDRYLLANLRYVTDGYLETLDLPVLRGRTFTHEEATESRAVVVVSKSFAKRAWPNVDPIGRRVRQGTTAQEREWLDVIGVVGNIEETHDVEDTWYLPYPLAAPSEIYLVVHAEGAGTGLGRGAVRAAIREIDPQQPLDWVRGLHELHVGSYGHHRTGSVLMTFFAVFGLLVAGLGIYGVVAANLARRRRELAVRLALGATPGHVVWLVLRRGLALMLAGLLVGGVAALGLVRVLVRVLSSVRADVPLDFQIIQRLGGDDYVVCAVAALVVAAIAFGASLVPAARASRIEPARLLRE